MHIRIQNLIDRIRNSYWFLPSLMAVLSAVLAIVTIHLDSIGALTWLQNIGFVWTGGAEGARSLLSAIAGSMITVAGVTFSITMVAFTQASSQFGPRVLRNFMRDRSNQIVLGTFVTTFIYTVLVLRSIRDQPNNAFVPQTSITLSVLFSLASIAILIFFFHHAARSIQAPKVVARAAKDVFEAMDEVFPSQFGQNIPVQAGYNGDLREEKTGPPINFEADGQNIVSKRAGYLQSLDEELLMALAYEHDLVIKVISRPGDFVLENHQLGIVVDLGKHRLNLEKMQDAFLISLEPTQRQNLTYAIEQLVEIAVRSLSPSINDPFTATICINWLGAALCRLANKDFPSAKRYDHQRNLRLIIERPVTYADLVDTALTQIRQYAGCSSVIYLQLLDMLTKVMAQTDKPEDREHLMNHAVLVRRAAHAELEERSERTQLEDHFNMVIKARREKEQAKEHP